MDTENLIFGIRTVIEAIRSGKIIEKVLIRKGLDNELFIELFQLVRNGRIPFQYVPVEKLNRITRKNHQGIIAYVSPVEFQPVEALLPFIFESGQNPLLLITDQVTDVRNFGAIARSAECAGVNAIVFPEKGSAPINADAVKTSAGALHHIPVCRTGNLVKTVQYLKDSGIKIVAATEMAGKIYTGIDMKVPVAIIVGSEEHGISPSLLNMADELVTIPIRGKIGSLNVSVAAALMIYEAVRQRESIQG